MLKIAYQMGVQKALSEEDVDRLIKEAQELGIDLEKTAIPGLGALTKGLVAGGKALGGGLKTMGGAAMKAGKGAMQGVRGSRGLSLGQRARDVMFGAGGHMSQAWRGLNPLQRRMMMGAGGAGLYAM